MLKEGHIVFPLLSNSAVQHSIRKKTESFM